MRIIAFDSGLERTGYAVFETNGSAPVLAHYGCILTEKKETLPSRLLTLGQKTNALFQKFLPEAIVLEQLFFNTNKKTAIAVAQAQGVVLYEAQKRAIHADFLSPGSIKQAVTGDGRADKKQVEKMVRLTFQLDRQPETDDVFDAIAGGLAYCSMNRLNMKDKNMKAHL